MPFLKYIPRDFSGSAGGAGSTPGQGVDPTCLAAKTPKVKQKQYCNKFSSNYQNGPC